MNICKNSILEIQRRSDRYDISLMLKNGRIDYIASSKLLNRVPAVNKILIP